MDCEDDNVRASHSLSAVVIILHPTLAYITQPKVHTASRGYHRLVRRLEGNMEHYTGGRRVTARSKCEGH
jgi:hypothetical protein